MLRTALLVWCMALCSAMYAPLQAAIIDTSDPGVIAAFQAGATVIDFENVSGVTPQAITSYTAGDPVAPASFVFNQIPGVQFSVGGAPGTNAPALYTLSGGISGDANSPATVLGPVDFDFTTKFNSGALIEIFFPAKVSKVGFWLNPSLGGALLIAADTNFAFSGETETTLESGNVTAGNFVGIERPTADIGGFKIIALSASGFSIDGFTFDAGGTANIPEPATSVLLASALLALAIRSKR